MANVCTLSIRSVFVTAVIACVTAIGLSSCSNGDTATPVDVVPSRIPAPTLRFPVNGENLAPTTVALTWEKVSNVRSYEVEWRIIDPENGAETLGQAATDGLSHLLSDLAMGTQVHWKVRAMNVNSESPWSQERTFTAITAPKPVPAPKQLLPENGKMGMPRFAEIRWMPVENALSYEILVTIDADMRLFQADVEGLQEPALNLTQLIFTYPYWWKVRALGPSGYSEWSPVWIFTVQDGEIGAPPG